MTMKRLDSAAQMLLRLSLVAIMAIGCNESLLAPEPSLGPLRLIVVSGDNQSGVVNTALANPLVIKATDAKGKVVAGVTVNFVVISGGGRVFAGAATTNIQGVAQDYWTLGTRTTDAQTLEVRSVDPTTGQAIVYGRFAASALPAPAAQLAIVAGNQQSAVVGTSVSVAPAVKVSDQYGNGISGVAVNFAVSQGGGSVTGASQSTNANGVATAGTWILGTVAGANALSVTTPGVTLTGSPAQVAATGLVAAPSKLVTPQRIFSPRIGTIISPAALVTDANGNGIPNVVVTFTVKTGGGALDGVNSLAAKTDAAGMARVDWSIGQSVVSNTLQVTAQGLAGSPITFVAIPYECDCWSSKALMPTPRRDIGIGLLNGLIHTVAGSPGPYSSVNEVYDPANNQWTTRSPVSEPYAFPASGVISGRIYLASGFGFSGLTDRVQSYDPGLDEWTPRAPIPTRRIEAASAVTGGLLYVMGGDNTGSGTDAAVVEAYDPVQDHWTTKSPLPTSRFLATAAAFGGRIYVVGGVVGHPTAQVLARVDVYDPPTNSWTAASSMPTPRYGATVAFANGLLYVIGGRNPGKLATLEVYDPATDVWVSRTPMPTPRGSAVSAFVNGKIFVLSGRDDTGAEVFGTNEAYQP
jgi:hypothetical protein